MPPDRSPRAASLSRRLYVLVALAVCGGTLLSAGLAVTGLVGGRVNGRLDTITHFTPFYLAGVCLGLLLSLALPALLRNVTAVAGVAGLLACGALMAPEFLDARVTPPGGRADRDFKVIGFNTWGGNPHPERALAWLLQQNADVIVLEEGGGVQYDLVKRGGYHLSCGNCYASVLSKAEPVWTNTPANWRIHPQEVTVVSLADPAGPITVLGVHRAWPNRPWVYRPQMAALAQAVAKYPARQMIVAGDFNATPWSYALRDEDRTLGLIRRTRALFTWPADRVSHDKLPAPFAVLPIDHVYAGPGWATVRVERGPKLGSDHYPVVVTLRRVSDTKDQPALATSNPATAR
jgi:endonuclease/exonuclease/phosphatase (EEP) superfamily protein YafD